jgi:hypothetical protein
VCRGGEADGDEDGDEDEDEDEDGITVVADRSLTGV